jgi:ABC-type multidrug transport system fused ATPase/permease subunit
MSGPLIKKDSTEIAVVYLILVLSACLPLILERAIHHGNGIAFLAAVVLTTPFSWVFFFIIDNLSNENAFYQTGTQYIVSMMALCLSALLNAVIIYYFVFTIERIVAKKKKENLT